MKQTNDDLLRNVHRPAFECFLSCATFFIFVLSRQIAAAPASLKEAYGDMFDVGVAIPSAMLSEAERLTLCTNFTAVTPRTV
jgi:hypothetical protein